MRLEQLHYFVTLLQEGTYTKAAERLHISQPSLTASIKAMEKELDKPLLTRNTRNIALTEEGKQVLAFAKETLTSYQNLLHNLAPSTIQLSGETTIIASKFFCELILEPFLYKLHTIHPKIKARMIEYDYPTKPKQLSSMHYRFAILTHISAKDESMCEPGFLISNEDFFDNQYHYQLLFTDRFGFCVAKSSLLSSLPTIYPSTIDQTQFQSTIFPFGDASFTENIYMASNNPKLHINAMLRENTYCNIPYFVYQHYFAQEEALTFRTYSNDMNISYYLVYPFDAILTETEQVFINELQSYLTQMQLK